MICKILIFSVVALGGLGCMNKDPEIHQSWHAATGDQKQEIQSDSIQVVERFYSQFLKTQNYVQFYMPEIDYHNGLYRMDMETYLNGLRASNFFTSKYIQNDSLRLAKCVDEFNSKKYTEDLEGFFLDECEACADLNTDNYYGTQEIVAGYSIESARKTGKSLSVTVRCKTDMGDLGDPVIVRLEKQGKEYLIDSFLWE